MGCPRGEEGLLRRQYIWYVGVSYYWVYSVRMTEGVSEYVWAAYLCASLWVYLQVYLREWDFV